jgi:hypothetical protein
MMQTWRKLRTLSTEEILLLVEAGVALSLGWVGVRILPYRALPRLDGHSETQPSQRRERKGSAPDRIAWSVQVMARRLPGKMTCLIQALAADAMLRRRGYQPQMRIGVAGRDRTGKIEAHAWVECEGKVVIGDVDDLATYAILSGPPRS